jgi:hypothetical protein
VVRKKPAENETTRPNATGELLSAYVDQFMQKVGDGSIYGKKMGDFPAGRMILGLDREGQAEAVEGLLDRLLKWDQEIAQFRSTLAENETCGNKPGWNRLWNRGCVLRDALETLLRRKLPLGEARLIRLLRWPLGSKDHISSYMHCLAGLTNAAEYHAESNAISPSLCKVLGALARTLSRETWDKPCRKAADRLRALLPGRPQIQLEPGEAWSDAALADLGRMKGKTRQAWDALLLHCQVGGRGKCSERWRSAAEPLLDAVGFQALKKRLLRWFPLVDRPRTQPIPQQHVWGPDYDQLIKEPHVELLRGLAWCCGLRADAELARALTRLALSAYRKIPGKGPRLVSLGNACVNALGLMPGLAPVGQLAVLKAKVDLGTAQKEIEKAFNAAVAREGLSRDEVEKLAVSTYGLEEIAKKR